MEIITAQSGRRIGGIALSETLQTMEVGDIWRVSTSDVSHTTIAAICTRQGAKLGRFFHTSCPSGAETITITRTK